MKRTVSKRLIVESLLIIESCCAEAAGEGLVSCNVVPRKNCGELAAALELLQIDLIFALPSFILFVGGWRLASPPELAIPTIVEQLQSATFLGRKPTARVEAMVVFFSMAACWSSFGGRGWQECIEAGETLP